MLNSVCLARHAYRKRLYAVSGDRETTAGAACIRFLNEHEAKTSQPDWLPIPKAVIIPNGVPHWFKEVEAPFDYYVVKVR